MTVEEMRVLHLKHMASGRDFRADPIGSAAGWHGHLRRARALALAHGSAIMGA